MDIFLLSAALDVGSLGVSERWVSAGDRAQIAGLATGEAVEADCCDRVGEKVDHEPLVVKIGEFEGFVGQTQHADLRVG